MTQALLETLVKLAAAGTSGVCIVCVVASAYILLKMNDDAPPQKHSTLKTFMILAFLVALVSAGTTITAYYLDHKTKVALIRENKKLNQENKVVSQQNIQLAQQNEVLNQQNIQLAEREQAFRAAYEQKLVERAADNSEVPAAAW